MSSDVQGSSDQVILVTGGYDHTIKMWQAHTGVCQRTAQHTDSVSLTLTVSALQMAYPYQNPVSSDRGGCKGEISQFCRYRPTCSLSL
jgi:WD40 repeat protein